MCRSGSTWLYNAVRLLAKHARVSGLAAGWITDRKKLLAHKNTVIKIHEFDAALASPKNVILTSHRDLRDVAASLSRIFKMVFSIDALRATVAAHDKWSRVADFELHYEDLLGDQMRELQRLARALRLPDAVVRRIDLPQVLEELSREKFTEERSTRQRFDSVNLLHDGHITDGRHGSWEGILSAEAVGSIEREFRPWLEKRGYLVRAPLRERARWRLQFVFGQFQRNVNTVNERQRQQAQS